jgi:hypothetical protein
MQPSDNLLNLLFKVLVCSWVLLLSVFPAIAQSEKDYLADSINVLSTKSIVFDLKPVSETRFSTKLPIKNILVQDARLDTSYLCIFRRPLGSFSVKKVESRKMKPANGFSQDFTSFLHSYFSRQLANNASEKMLCFVKQLRLFDADEQSDTTLHGKLFIKLQVELDCYYSSNENYYPAIRIDSVLSLAFSTTRSVTVINEAFSQLAALIGGKMNSADFGRFVQRRRYSLDSLQKRYAVSAKSFLPLQLNKPVKGIYRNFEEWKNNTPYYTDTFTVIRRKQMPLSIYDSKDVFMDIFQVFGLSDGRHFWIQSMGELYPLIRVGNGFEFYGIARYQAGGGTPYAGRDNPSNYLPDASASGVAAGIIMNGLFGILPASNYNCLHGIDLYTGMIY